MILMSIIGSDTEEIANCLDV